MTTGAGVAHDIEDRSTAGFIVLLGLLAGAVVYLVITGHDRDWPMFGPTALVYWYTLVLALPPALALTVSSTRDAMFWRQGTVLAVALALLSAWAAWSISGAPNLDHGAVLGPFAVSICYGLFIVLPFLQGRLRHRRWRLDYPGLFEDAWQNALVLGLAFVFIGISWAVLHLCASLFSLVGIDVFTRLFRSTAFVCLVTGLLAGLGIVIGRSLRRPVQVARQVLFAIFKGLLPLLSAVSVLFVAALPVTGLEGLWSTPSATILLSAVMIAMVLFTNAVYQDGSGEPPYPRALRRLVDAGLLVLPVYAALAIHALWLRIEQYGWTADRFWATAVVLLLACHAAGYAYATIGPRGGWLGQLRPVNIMVAMAAVAVVLLSNSPLLDPHRITVHSQLARLHDGRTSVQEFDFEQLRFASGRRGYAAAIALRDDPVVASEPRHLAILEEVIESTVQTPPWQFDERRNERLAANTSQAARQRLPLAPGATDPGAGWWDAVAAGTLQTGTCLYPDSDCLLLTPDLDGDGIAEALACDLGSPWIRCQFHAREEGGEWHPAGLIHWPGPSAKVEAGVRRGEATPLPRRWPDVEVAGVAATVTVEPAAATVD